MKEFNGLGVVFFLLPAASTWRASLDRLTHASISCTGCPCFSAISLKGQGNWTLRVLSFPFRFFRPRGEADIRDEGLAELIGVPNERPLRVWIPFGLIGWGGVRYIFSLSASLNNIKAITHAVVIILLAWVSIVIGVVISLQSGQ